jgi:DNA-binding beta-propeller fold protein YncE
MATLLLDNGTGQLNHVAVNQETNRVYITDDATNGVILLKGATHHTGATVITTVPADATPFAAAVNPETDRVYVSNLTSSDVSVIQDEQTGA